MQLGKDVTRTGYILSPYAHRGSDQARGNNVAADPAARIGDGDRPAEGDDAALAGRVRVGGEVVIAADQGEDAGQVDDGPATAILQHGAHLGTAAMKGAGEVGVDHRSPPLVRAGIDRTVTKPPPA